MKKLLTGLSQAVYLRCLLTQEEPTSTSTSVNVVITSPLIRLIHSLKYSSDSKKKTVLLSWIRPSLKSVISSSMNCCKSSPKFIMLLLSVKISSVRNGFLIMRLPLTLNIKFNSWEILSLNADTTTLVSLKWAKKSQFPSLIRPTILTLIMEPLPLWTSITKKSIKSEEKLFSRKTFNMKNQ